MRAYLTTTAAKAQSILTVGYDDPDQFDGRAGNWLGDRPLSVFDGFAGDVTLRLDIADDVFRQYEVPDDDLGFRQALVPADVLNGLTPPRVIDPDAEG